MTTSLEARTAIKTALEASGVLPAGFTVYAKPVVAPSAPCAVVEPRSPYRVQETYGYERIGLRVTLLLPVGNDLDDLDALLDPVVEALWAVETVGVESVTDVGTVTESDSGVSYMSAAIDLWVI